MAFITRDGRKLGSREMELLSEDNGDNCYMNSPGLARLQSNRLLLVTHLIKGCMG